MKMKSFIAITKALSDSHRVRALVALRNGELCVCQIIELLELAPSTVSKHMSVLKQAGIVDSRKEGRWIYYRLSDHPKNERDITQMIDLCVSILCGNEDFNKDDKKMDKITGEALDTLCKRQRK